MSDTRERKMLIAGLPPGWAQSFGAQLPTPRLQAFANHFAKPSSRPTPPAPRRDAPAPRKAPVPMAKTSDLSRRLDAIEKQLRTPNASARSSRPRAAQDDGALDDVTEKLKKLATDPDSTADQKRRAREALEELESDPAEDEAASAMARVMGTTKMVQGCYMKRDGTFVMGFVPAKGSPAAVVRDFQRKYGKVTR